jgi:hypothetical protein
MRKLALLATFALVLGCGGRSSNNNDGGSTPDSANDTSVQPQEDGAAQEDAPVQTDASQSGNPTPGQIQCGETSTCDATTQVCCLVRGDGGSTYSCIATTDTCGGTTSNCDEPGDCGSGEVCCRAGGGGGGGAATCTAAASCTGRQLCHVDGDCSGTTPVCCPSTNNPGTGSCRATCDTGVDGGTPDGIVYDASVPDGIVYDGNRPDTGGSDASTGTSTPGVVDCGNATCNPATQFCCQVGTGGSATYTCMNTGDTCGGGSQTCDEPGDCSTSGQVCCRSGASGTAPSSSCVDSASCTNTQRCHTSADCSGTTPLCCPSTITNGGSCKATGSC